MNAKPFALKPRFVERVWGRTDLSPLYAATDRRVGEVWFLPEDDPDYPILVKFIFTSDRLSVQVHPDDAYAAAHHSGSRGKTEMWHILRAEQGASIALGFQRSMERDEVRAAIAEGRVEQVLHWQSVRAGESYFTPAGTVHAIGGGLTLCEIQQNSDITYRLYDYGRPRELHLERGLEVSRFQPYNARRELPVECEFFRTSELLLAGGASQEHSPCGAGELLIAVEGEGTLDGSAVRAGEVWLVPPGVARVDITGGAPGLRLLRTHR